MIMLYTTSTSVPRSPFYHLSRLPQRNPSWYSSSNTSRRKQQVKNWKLNHNFPNKKSPYWLWLLGVSRKHRRVWFFWTTAMLTAYTITHNVHMGHILDVQLIEVHWH